MHTTLEDTISADICMLQDHPSTTKGKLGSQLVIRMHLEKARGPTALPTGWIANRQSSPWHFAKFTKPVHTCISRLRDLTENTDYRTWTSTLKSLHLHLVLTAVVCTASGRSLSLRALLTSSGELLYAAICSCYMADEPAHLDNWELAEMQPWLRMKHIQQLRSTCDVHEPSNLSSHACLW